MKKKNILADNSSFLWNNLKKQYKVNDHSRKKRPHVLRNQFIISNFLNKHETLTHNFSHTFEPTQIIFLCINYKKLFALHFKYGNFIHYLYAKPSPHELKKVTVNTLYNKTSVHVKSGTIVHTS